MKRRFLFAILSCSILSMTCSSMLVSCSGGELNVDKLTRSEYFDSENLSLTVSENGKKVTENIEWNSSDTFVAKVINGLVFSKKVSKKSSVTFTANIKGNEAQKASVTIDVLPSIIDLKNSYGELDTSKLLSEGIVKVDSKKDNALIAGSIYGNQFYLESTITIDSVDQTVENPKIGYVFSEYYNGVYNDSISRKSNAYCYLDAKGISSTVGTKKFGFADNGTEMVSWNFNEDNTFEADEEIKVGDKFKFGMAKFAENYLFYYGKADSSSLKIFKNFENFSLSSGASYYSFIVGNGLGYTVSNIKTITNRTEIDNAILNSEPTKIKVSTSNVEIFAGDNFIVKANVDILNYDSELFTFTTKENSFFSIVKQGSYCFIKANTEYEVEEDGEKVMKPIDVTYTDKISIKYNGKLLKEIDVTIQPVL